jgi:flagellar biosynthetic protein FliR
MTLSFSFGINLFLLVFMRMSGLFIFNPILGRENIPMYLRAGLGFICALAVAPTLSDITVQINDVVQLIIMGLGELLVGLALGILVSLILNIVQLAGELIDMQMGITMAQMYDSHSGTNMPLIGSLYNAIMIFCFFAGNAHLSLVSFMSDSFRLIAPGAVIPTQQSMQYIFSLGRDYFELGFRMALPVVAVEIICQVCMGMLMRAVPSINIFNVGMHLTALVGIVIILLSMTTIVSMCGNLITFLTEKASEVIRLIGRVT